MVIARPDHWGLRISVLDTGSSTIGKQLWVGNSPAGLAPDEANHRLYVVNRDSDTISVIDTGSYRLERLRVRPTSPEVVSQIQVEISRYAAEEMMHRPQRYGRHGSPLCVRVVSGGPG
jgi:hypothetical protein